MTEDFEDGNYLVRVRAQVMTRDDSTGGWVPMGGGGLSNVSVRKRGLAADPDDVKHEYLIFGKRISDQSRMGSLGRLSKPPYPLALINSGHTIHIICKVVLRCIIKKDFEYNKVMPTFHHWKTGDKKFGLTFQTAADARAFDKGVRTAVEELIEGIHGTLPRNVDVGDDDVFMTLNLPVERGDSRSSSDSSGGKPPACVPPAAAPPETENYSYVQLTPHEYMYPVVGEGEGSLKKRPPLELPNKRKERCRHCQEPFSNESNVRGSCPYAPDRVRSAIECVACLGIARRVLHSEPCACGSSCGGRWLALALLSLIIPCLWCYPPLRACHFCCVSCGLCGGKHRPAS